jgi:hypothetical protein
MLRPALSSVERPESERKAYNSEHDQHEEHQVVACKIIRSRYQHGLEIY